MKESDIIWTEHAAEQSDIRAISKPEVVAAIITYNPARVHGKIRIRMGDIIIVFEPKKAVIVTVMHKREGANGSVKKNPRELSLERNKTESIQARQKKKKYDRMLKRNKLRSLEKPPISSFQFQGS